MATTTRLLTAEDVEAMGAAAEGRELIYGVLQDWKDMGGRHGELAADLLTDLNVFVRPRNLGRLYSSDTRFVLFRAPDVYVKPDVAFVRTDRLPPEAERAGVMALAPDLAVEVVSLHDRFADVMGKVDLYRQAGVPLIWLVEPRGRTVTIYAGDAEPRVLTDADTLDGGDVLPGFALPVATIFR